MQDKISTRQAKDFSALKIGEGDVRYIEISDRSDLGILHQLYSEGEIIHIAGKGTNSVFGTFSGLVAELSTKGHEWLDSQVLKIEAGEDWQTAVELSVANSCHGIERLTTIPGTVGAAPVQNIGAFGQLLSNRLRNIEVYDYGADEFITLTPEDCGFGAHRESNFKSKADWQTYVIVSITLSLLEADEFTEPGGDGLLEFVRNNELSINDIAMTEESIRLFRQSMYPDYKFIPNTGSYFTNFEVANEQLGALHPEIMSVKHKETFNGKRTMFQCKDLLESIGIRGDYQFGSTLKMYQTHNNFLINQNSDATLQDLISVHQLVNSKLFDKYGIRLVPEAEFVDDTKDRWVK